MPKEYIVELTWMECRLASVLGATRMLQSVINAQKNGRKAKQSIGGEREDLWGSNIWGAHSELASAKFLNCYWTPTIGGYKEPDLADFIQVRSRSLARYELILRDDDPRDEIYILLHYEDYPRFVIRGWRWGHDVERLGRRDNPGGYRESIFLPAEQLLDFDEFPWERLRAWKSKDVREAAGIA